MVQSRTLGGVLVACVALSFVLMHTGKQEWPLATAPLSSNVTEGAHIVTDANRNASSCSCAEQDEEISALRRRIQELEDELGGAKQGGLHSNPSRSNQAKPTPDIEASPNDGVIRIPPVACIGAKPRGKRPPVPTRYVKSWHYFRNDPYWAVNSAHGFGIPTPPPNLVRST
jgi:hypothetical protein